ncbi:MAG: hypothetical protein H2B00_00515 [Nitrosopumilaceae archaeon]|uniref:Uncharacterized protein n=2 Tax=Candidatus Nitrosomaritimum aestuariumsis TaxID=3342354 RepID=A0AC60VX64_9ARCH|nr:hypothetical protein [Nitrosopumilaceae archaeon]MBA4460982.1 hypothetical protein [Nitrosopumilaceae archaeon]MBA4462942.1 hypothetical protein [Nitrosopumilaceae archaeon]
MSRVVALTIILASILVISSSSAAWAAQMDARINPNLDESFFKVNYQKTVFIEYPNGGKLFDELHTKEWTVRGVADESDPGVQELIGRLNSKIQNDGSASSISALTVTYDFHLKGRNLNTSIDYKVILEGTLTDYVINKDQTKTLVDMGWRGLSVTDEIVVDGVEINHPITILKESEPVVYDVLKGSEAEEILSKNLIDAEFIKDQPMTNWHFLFDPTGINVDASGFGLDESIAGFVVSHWTMGESSIREGRQVERVFEAEVNADQNYVVRSVQSADAANLSSIGFGALDSLDGVEIIGVTPTAPEGFATTSTGEFPILIVYGMAGMAAIGGIAFFVFSNRALKNQETAQTGIDPSRLTGYQTSASAGGYQTNRGEAQLRDESNYQQTRNVYESETTQQAPPPATPAATEEEAACGCAASAEMGSECDCEMQGSCLCDASCRCNADICRDQVSSMS